MQHMGGDHLPLQVMRSFGWSPKDEELKDMVNVIDQDGNGDISFNEFVWLMTK
jgi:calmodulin